MSLCDNSFTLVGNLCNSKRCNSRLQSNRFTTVGHFTLNMRITFEDDTSASQNEITKHSLCSEIILHPQNNDIILHSQNSDIRTCYAEPCYLRNNVASNITILLLRNSG